MTFSLMHIRFIHAVLCSNCLFIFISLCIPWYIICISILLWQVFGYFHILAIVNGMSYYIYLFIYLFIYLLFRTALAAYGDSQARSQITATGGLHHSHSNAGSVPHLQLSRLNSSNTKSLTYWTRPGIKPTSSWILVGFITAEPQWELL